METRSSHHVAFVVSETFARLSLPLVKEHLNQSKIFGRLELFPTGSVLRADHTAGEWFSTSLTFGAEDRASGEFSRQALKEWQSFSDHDGFASIRFVALKLLNRNDLSGSLRMLEREVLFASTVIRVLQVLDSRHYSLLVFDVTPHQFLQYVIWKVAEWRGLKVLFFQPVGAAPLMIPRTGLEECVKIRFRSDLPGEVMARCEAIFDDEVQGLIQGEDPPYMQTQKARDMTVGLYRQKWAALQHSVRWLFYDRYSSSIDFLGHRQGHPILRRLAAVMSGRSLQFALRDAIIKQPTGEASAENYALFALHYEPERTSLPEGLPIDFQADAVGIARSLLPAEVKLFVKEHYSQQTSALRGFAGRSPMFYGLIDAFAGTQFLPIEQNLSQAISGASFVFTLTGSVAIEAAMRGVPVLYFGTPWWEGLPGSYKISRETRTSERAEYRPSTLPEVQKFLDSPLLQRTVPGVGGESRTNAARRFGDLPEGFYEAEASSVALCIEAVI